MEAFDYFSVRLILLKPLWMQEQRTTRLIVEEQQEVRLGSMGSPHPCKVRGVADVVGLSCRFPESASASDFWANLVSGRSLVTATDTRWPVGIHGVPRNMGLAPGYQFFDAPFFAVHGKQAQVS